MAIASCSSKSDPAPSSPVDTGVESGPVVVTYDPQGCGYRVAAIDGFPDFEATADSLGADAAPKHVRLGLGGGVDASKAGYADPSTSFAVIWQTDVDTKVSKLRFGDTETALTHVVDGISYIVPQELNRGPEAGIRFHEAHACGLTPGRTVYYQVGGSAGGKDVWSDVRSLTVAPAKGGKDPVPFAFFGDTRDALGRSDLPVFKAITGRVKVSGARLGVFSGDAVLIGADQSLWDIWTNASDALAGSVVVAEAAGNHENELVRYFAHIAMPGATKNAERYASFDYGPVHFVFVDDYVGIVAPSIDVTNYRAEVLAWLDADLQKADGNRANVPWVVTVHHHPVYDSGADKARVAERKSTHDALLSLYDKYHVDLDLAGHDHFYERSKVLAADAVATKGTTYVICAGGGAPSYSTNPDNPLSQSIVHYDPDTFQGLYGLATADATKLDVKVYRIKGAVGTSPADDEIVDTFTLSR